MNDQMINVVLNIALAGFTGLLAWFLKELWSLWKEGAAHREKLQASIERLDRQILESSGVLRDMLAEMRIEMAKDYVSMVDFKDLRDQYVRPELHKLKERVSTLEGVGLYAKPT